MLTFPELQNLSSVTSPALWVDRAGVRRNIARMIAEVGGAAKRDRLRPHMKTHKMREVLELQIEAGIDKCKAATLREAQIAAETGVGKILIAHQLVGPKIARLRELIEEHPSVEFASLVDDSDALDALLTGLGDADRPFPLWIDVDCGMHRTGIPFGDRLNALRDRIESSTGVSFGGLHVYDGHIHDPDLETRKSRALPIIESVRDYLEQNGPAPVAGGGTPTFGIWAREAEWDCCPGTTFFWDAGYGSRYPDLDYEIAAGLIARIISKPGDDLVCLDLGHKSVAAEMPLEKRALFPDLRDAVAVGQSEEHLVLRTPEAGRFRVGDVFLGIPAHICPTVALHATAVVFEDGELTGDTWKVAARDR